MGGVYFSNSFIETLSFTLTGRLFFQNRKRAVRSPFTSNSAFPEVSTVMAGPKKSTQERSSVPKNTP